MAHIEPNRLRWSRFKPQQAKWCTPFIITFKTTASSMHFYFKPMAQR